MYGFQCSAISGQRDTACVDPGMWCTVTPARRALSLPQAQELLSAQKHGALYNVQKEQLYAYEDAKKLADAWKYGCQQLLVPKMEGSLYIWEALLVLHAQQPQGVFPGENSIGFRKRKKKS